MHLVPCEGMSDDLREPQDAVSATRTRLLLVEDHEVVRQGLAALLANEPDFEVVGGAGSAEQAVAMVGQLSPDVVVMDITLGGMSGIEATAQLDHRFPEVKVIVLSMHDDAPTMERALRAGARGYVIKGRSVASLAEAIRAVNRGDVYLSPDTSESVIQAHGNRRTRTAIPLSPREREILALIAEGNTGRQIAERLGLKPKTIDNHRTRIMEKLDIHTTAGLVRYALRAGLV